MTKQEFMRKLEDALMRLKPEERKDILSDFEEHFAGGAASGKSEEEVAKVLGDPEVLAAQYTEGLPEPKPPVKLSGVAAGALASLALLLFDAIIAIPVIGTLFAVWASFWAVALAFLAAALALMVAPFINIIASMLASMGVFMIGISTLALAVLAGIGMVYVTKWFFKGIAGFVSAQIRIIRGGARA